MIKVGDRVRSFDFSDGPDGRSLSGKRACYVEGEVVGFEHYQGCERYVIQVERCIFGGVEKDAWPAKVYPPVNGTPKLFGGICDNVELI
tara:strand:- start:2179 stop:2445 length:267 start_codon:yes stop_codon:yes gene_type:complete